jgi:MFS superfamily sulfate permease-like transporter
VVALGAIDAILLAVVLALVRFIRLVARPMVESLGEVPGMPGFHSLARHPTAVARDGVLLFRFNGPIVFFNTPYFRRELLAALDRSGPGVRGVILDLIPVSTIDATGVLAIIDIENVFAARGLTLCGAGRATEWAHWRQRRGFDGPGRVRIYPTLESALAALAVRT